MTKQTNNYINSKKQLLAGLPKLVLILLWAVACFWLFESRFKYHFYYEEQNQLFLLDSEYTSHYLSKPAWLGCLIGDFLTQFYYYLYLGALILTGSLLCLGDQVRKNLEKQLVNIKRLQEKPVLASYIATLLALVIITWQARLCFDETYRLSSILCILGGTAMWHWHNFFGQMLEKWWKRAILLSITLIATYWLFGGLGLSAVIFFEILSKTVIPAIAVSAAVIAGILFIAPGYYNVTQEVAFTYPGKGKIVDFNDVRIAERNLQLDNEYYFGNYSKVVTLFEEHKDEVTDEMSFYYFLSLAQMGSMPEMMVQMKNPYLGTFEKIGSDTPMYKIKMINDLYWAIGDMTYTERAALLANTFSPKGRNARYIKRIAEANLVNGDTIAARKYLRLLEKTIVYNRWAKEHTPGNFPAPVKMEIEKKQQFVNTTGAIRLGDSCYTILTQLLDSNPENLVALNYLLCSDMLSGERETFILDFEKYNGGRIPFFQQIYNSSLTPTPLPQGEGSK